MANSIPAERRLRKTADVGPRTLSGATDRKLTGSIPDPKAGDSPWQADDRYRSLVNSIDAGFCVVEMKFDGSGCPIDYKFIEVNDAFADQTGLRDATGKWMRTLAPEHEQHWFDIYGNVALTGEAIRLKTRRTPSTIAGMTFTLFGSGRAKRIKSASFLTTSRSGRMPSSNGRFSLKNWAIV